MSTPIAFIHQQARRALVLAGPLLWLAGTPVAPAASPIKVAGQLLIDLNYTRGITTEANGSETVVTSWTNFGTEAGSFTKVALSPYAPSMGAAYLVPPRMTTNGAVTAPEAPGSRLLVASFPTPPQLQGNSPYSIEVWLWKNNSATDQRGVFAWTENTPATGDAGKFCAGDPVALHNNTKDLTWGTMPTNDNAWHHAVLTFDGSTEKIYLDKVLTNSGAKTLNIASGTYYPTLFSGIFSVAPPQTSFSLNGSIAAVRVHSDALSAADVSSNFTAGISAIPQLDVTVQALGASNVGGTTATLNGELVSTTDPATTALTFYYGTTDMGRVTSDWDHSITLAAPRNTGHFSTALTGLTPDTPYFYRIHGINANGEGWSPAHTFTPSYPKDILSFNFGVRGAAAISGTNITMSVPYGTDVTTLSGSFTHSGVSASPASPFTQDFSAPQTFIITATDLSTKSYTVTVTVLPPSYNWVGASNGSWFTPTDWSSSLPLAGKVAVFSNAGAGATVDIDGPGATAGGILFNNNVANTLIKSSTGSQLTLDNLGVDVNITTNAGSHTIGAKTIAATRVGCTGAGTVVLSSVGNTFDSLTPGNWSFVGSFLMDDSVVPNPSLTLTHGINNFSNGGASIPSRFNMTAGSLTLGGDFRLSQDGGFSISTITGGTVNQTGGWVQVGYNSGVATFNLGGNAAYSTTGMLDMSDAYVCNAYANFYGSSTASFGSINIVSSNSAGNGQYGLINLSDTASLTANSIQIAVSQLNSGGLNTGTLNQDGGTLTINGTASLAVSAPAGAPLSLLGSYNLYAGVFKARKIATGTGNTGTARLNFHGGTLAYNDTTAQPDFIALGAHGAAYIYEGATIDTAGQNVTVNTPLLAPTGSGVTSIPITAGGSSQFVPGAVRILRNAADTTGIGATAAAVVNPATGVLTAIRITNPGTDYTLPPTVTLDRGEGSTATLGTVAIGSNTFTGGLTKNGTGTLTLTGANTYTGNTTVNAGTLSLATPCLEDGADVILAASGAILNLNTGVGDTIRAFIIGGVAQAIGEWGAIGSGAIYESEFITGSGRLLVTSEVVSSPYSIWAAAKYPAADLSDPSADLDHDGMSNFQEFAFGLDPTKGSSVNPISVPFGKFSGTFSYTRNAASGLTYTVLTSTDLVTWSSAPASQVPGTPDANGVETVAVALTSYLPPAGGKLFVRVSAH